MKTIYKILFVCLCKWLLWNIYVELRSQTNFFTSPLNTWGGMIACFGYFMNLLAFVPWTMNKMNKRLRLNRFRNNAPFSHFRLQFFFKYCPKNMAKLMIQTLDWPIVYYMKLFNFKIRAPDLHKTATNKGLQFWSEN